MNSKMIRVLNRIIFCLILIKPILINGQNADQLRLHVFYTNDMQSQIGIQKATFLNPQFPPSLGGGASMAAIIKTYRGLESSGMDTVLLFDGGDFHNPASPLGEKSQGKAAIEFMNLLGYTAIVPGNLDFEPGMRNLKTLAESARFPILSANLIELSSNSIPDPLKASIIIDWAGIKVGIFGITSKSAELVVDADGADKVDFLSEVESAGQAVKDLRRQGADIVIAVTHLGLPYDAEEGYKIILEMEKMNIKKSGYVNAMELAHFVPGIDLVITGMIHRGYDEPWEDPVNHTLCVQNYAYGGNLGLITLLVDKKSKSLSGYELPADDGGMLLLNDDQFWPDQEMLTAIRDIEKKYTGDMDSIIGVTETTLIRSGRGESPMANLMCDAMIASGNADFAFNNFAGMRADIPIGPITSRDLAGVFPFGNKIVVVQMNGELLTGLIERSVAGYYSGMAIGGGQVIIDTRRESGDRIVKFHINNEPLNPEKIYRVAITEYLADGNYGMNALAFLPDEDFENTEVRVRDAVRRFIKEHTPIHIMPDGRWKDLNRSEL